MPSASRRRISCDISTAEAVGVIHDTMDHLNALWDEIHMDESQRVSRVDCFYSHIRSLMTDMFESEKEMVQSVKTSILEWIPEINSMRVELNMPPFDTKQYKPESVGLYRAMDKERTRLLSLKEDRINGQREIVKEVRTIAMRLGQEAGELPSIEEVWDDEVLSALQNRVLELSDDLSQRISSVGQWKTDMLRCYHQMGTEPASESIAAFVNVDVDDEERLLDFSFMDAFKEAHQDAMGEFNEWLEQVQFDYTEAMVKLEELWELCHVPDNERHCSKAFNPITSTAADLEKVRQEVDKLRQCHQDRLDVYAKFKQWKDLWMDKVEYENHASEKAAYTNRGGQLQAILQRQKYISNHLPIVLRELKAETQKYNDSHEPHDAILIDGQSPWEHAEWIMDEYKVQKELERLRKKQAALAGASTTKMTPKKRNADGLFGSPGASVSKLAKTQTHSRFPPRSQKMGLHYVTPMRFNPISMSTTSLHSVIDPVQPHSVGPKTSSPNAGSQPAMASPFAAMKRRAVSRLPTASTPVKSTNQAS